MTNLIEEIKKLAEFAKSILPAEALNPNVLDAIKAKPYMEALIAASELLQQVVVLEEGANPQVDDFVIVEPDERGYCISNREAVIVEEVDESRAKPYTVLYGTSFKRECIKRIVLRGGAWGKPVIYQQGTK